MAVWGAQVMGMMVLVKTAVVQMAGGECFMNRSNQASTANTMMTTHAMLDVLLQWCSFDREREREKESTRRA